MSRRLDVARRFGENLTRCRERANLSQEELGYRASLHRTEVSLLERGARIPRADTVVRLAGSLGASFGDLVEGVEWSPGYTHIVEGAFDVSDRMAEGDGGDVVPSPAGSGGETP